MKCETISKISKYHGINEVKKRRGFAKSAKIAADIWQMLTKICQKVGEMFIKVFKSGAAQKCANLVESGI